MTMTLTYNDRDIAALLATSAPDAGLAAIARRAISVDVEGRQEAATAIEAGADKNNNVEFRYTFAAPPSSTDVTIDSLLLKELPFGHRQAFSAVDGTGNEIARRLLSTRESSARVAFDAPAQRALSGGRFLDFFFLGIRHIVTGYDHLLFLFGLLLVCRNVRAALLLITCFTLAHSLTLALSTFGLVDLPSRFVEATIAGSILFVGLENLFRGNSVLAGRWALTFGFGLIHGLGFASVLHDLEIAKTGWNAVVPLLAFNSGVEAGQLAIAALVVPLIWQMRARPALLRVGVPACSMIVAAAGAYWLLERTLLS
jgi:hydrogenase/urease accessory protein HupE